MDGACSTAWGIRVQCNILVRIFQGNKCPSSCYYHMG
jgi:hypothetical protein